MALQIASFLLLPAINNEKLTIMIRKHFQERPDQESKFI